MQYRGQGQGGKGQKRKITTGFFFMSCFFSLSLSHLRQVLWWFFLFVFFSNPNLIIGKSLDLRFCNSSSNGATVKSFPSYSKGCSFSGIIIILLGTFYESKECAAQKRIHIFILEVLSFELTYFNPSFIKFVLLVYGKP